MTMQPADSAVASLATQILTFTQQLEPDHRRETIEFLRGVFELVFATIEAEVREQAPNDEPDPQILDWIWEGNPNAQGL